ncbi:MAG TPA: tripartite tricarboxylate transporter TctB family protein [Quisquiliibacterium sp.]|nr:tripartite tricarboxylate transporter TctB family protein [Quisquiliibacterium sp.]
MQIRNHRDLWAGVMFFGFGALFMVLSQQYQIGSAARMGPGYFPFVLGRLLALLGLIIFFGAFSPGNAQLRIVKVGWRELGLILGAVALFGALLPSFGIVVALVVLIGVSAVASHDFSVRDTLIAIVVLAVFSYFVFVKGLELQFPLWPKFMSN